MPAELVEGQDPDAGTVMVIGEEPTFEEDTAGRPMVSRSRAIIRSLMKDHWRGNYVLEYAKKCHPWHEDKNSAEKCSPYVRATFEEVCPDRLLILGRRVAKAVLGRDVDELATRKGHSWVRHSSGKVIPVFVVMDPWDVAKRKNRFLRKYMKEDVKWALQDDQRLFDPPFNAKVHIVENVDDAAVALGELYNHDWVAYDAETAGRPWSKLFLCKSVALTPAGSDDTYVWGPKALRDPVAVEALTDLMSDPIIGKVGHNEKYDRMVFRAAFKTEVRGFILDTQLVRRLSFPGIDATLETCAELVGMGGHKQAFAVRLKKAKKAITSARTRHNKSKGRQLSLIQEDPIIAAAIENDHEDTAAYAYCLVPSPWLELYNASDTITTRRLALGPYGLEYVRKHAPTRNIWRNVVRNATPAIEQVEAWGIPVDRGGIERFRAYADRELAAVTQRIQVYDIDPNSHQQVSKLLFGRLGLKNPHDPKSQSSDKKALKAMSGQHPVIADLIEHRRLAKLRSSYGDLDRFIREDGRIHPSLKIDGTESGRLSCVEPGLHQIPRAATVEAKLLKNCFAAAKGRTMLQLDYCLAPGTRVLTAKLDWVPVEQVQVGDELVGFDEQLGPANKMRRAVVEHTRKLVQPCYKVVTDRGTVVCSELHGWVARRGARTTGGTSRTWVQARDLKEGDTLGHFVDPWEYDTSRIGGYMAGLLDGEGWVNGTVGFGQNPGTVLDSFCEIAERAGFVLDKARSSTKTSVIKVYPTGQCAGLRMLGMYKPERLMRKSDTLWEGRRSWGKHSRPARVLNIEFVGEQEVVAVQTSTRTMVAEGFLTHNSQLEYRIAAYLSGDPVMRQMFLEGSDLHMQTAKLISTLYWGIKAEDVGKEHRSQTKCFHPDTEVLTKGGWKRIPDLLPGEEVAQATPQDSAVDLSWVVPTEVFTQANEHAELVHLKNEGIDVRVTPDHRMLVFRANGKHAVVLPSEFGRARSWKNSGVLHTTDTGEGSYPSEVLLRLAVALQADGTIRKTGYTTFGFSKSRKVERLRNLLSCAQIPWTETVNAKGVTTFTIQSQYSRSIRALLDGKCFSWRWLGLPLALRLAVLDEAPRWDGHTPKHAPHRKYFSTLKRNVDVLQAMAAISGVKTRLVPTPTVYSLTLKSKDGSRGDNVTVNNVPHTGDVVCLSVPSSFVLVRDGGVPVVTGQSFNFGLLYGMTDRTIAAMLNIPLEQAVKLRAVIMGKWKALQAWIDAQIAYAKATGTCRTFWNGEPARIRSLIAIANEGDDSASRGAQITARNGSYNTPIQGTASDFMLCSITKLVPWLRQSNLDAKLVLTVHDSVIFDVAEDHVHEMAARAESIMTAYETGGVPIVVDAEAGRAWGSLEKLELPKASVAAE